MKRSITQPCVVLGSADRAALFRDELHRHGVRFISFASSIGRLRRQLVLGEDASLILCVLLSVDDLTPADRRHLARLLADRRCFATRVFCIGVVHESESFTRWAPLGCDAYVSNPRGALEAIRAHTRASSSPTDIITAQQLLRAAAVAATEVEALTADTGGELLDDGAGAPQLDQQVQASRARMAASAGETRRGHKPPT